MPTVKAIRVELELTDGTFTRRIVRADKSVRRFARGAGVADRSVKKLDHSNRRMGAGLRDTVIVLGLARSAMMNLNSVLTGPIRKVISVNAEFERMRVLLKGLSGEIGEAADAIANSNFDFMIEKARTAPFSLQAMIDSFVKMKSVGIDPTKGALDAMTNAIANFGGDDALLKRASIALQQMAGKGVISMEELRQQLGEAVPSAIRLMARSMNLTFKELVDRISKGEVEASSALKNLFSEFNKTFGGSNQRLMQTFGGKLRLLNTEWLLFLQKIGEGGEDKASGALGMFETMKSLVDELTFAIKDPIFVSFGRTLGVLMRDAALAIRDVIVIVLRFRKEIGQFIAVLAGMFIIRKIAALFMVSMAGMMTAVRAMSTAVIFSGREIAVMAIKIRAATGAGNTFSVALARIAVAGRVVRGVLHTMLGPIGILLLALYELAEAFDFFGNRAEEALDKLDAGEFIDEAGMNAIEKRIKKFKEDLEELIKERDRSFKPAVLSRMSHLKEEDLRLLKEIKELEKQINAEQEKLDKARRAAEIRNAESAARDRVRVLDHVRKEIEADYLEEIERIEVLRELHKEGTDQRREADAAAIEARKKFHVAMIASYKDQLDAETLLLSGAEGMKRAEIEATLTLLRKGSQHARTAQKQDPLGVATLYGGKSDTTLSVLAREALRVDKAMAVGNAALKGFTGELAKFEVMFESGMFAGEDPLKIAELMHMAMALDALNLAVKKFRKNTADVKRGIKTLADAGAKVAEQLKQSVAEFNNPGQGETSALTNLRQRLAKAVALTRSNSQEYIRAKIAEARIIADFERKQTLDELIELKERARNARNALLSRRESAEAGFAFEEKRLRQLVDLEKLTGAERLEAKRVLNESIAALREKMLRDSEGPIEQMLRNWKNVTERMEEAGAQFIGNFVDKMVDGITEGKFEFEKFADFVIKEILRIQIRAAIASAVTGDDSGNSGGGIFSGIFGEIFKGIFSSGSTTTSTARPAGRLFAKGGAFMKGVQAFAKGGVVNGATLFPFAKGTGLMGEAGPEAIMPLTRLRSGDLGVRAEGTAAPQDIQINLINQTGKNVEGKQGQPKFDGKKVILDIVLQEASTPGNFRSGLREAMA